MSFVVKSKLVYWIYGLLIALLLAIGVLHNAYFEITCAICAALFWFIQIRLTVLLKSTEVVQRKQCKPLGVTLLPPALGIIAAGVSIFFCSIQNMPIQMTYGIVAVAIFLLACLLLQIITLWKNRTSAGRVLRLTIWAAMSAPLSLIVARILYVTNPDEAAELSCMSVIIFGIAALLIAANIVMISFCGYKSTRNSIKTISALTRSKKLVFAQITIIKDIFFVAGKVGISVLSVSFFMFANALYSTGMGVS